MGRLFFLIFTLIIVIIAVVIATYNVDQTTINLYLKIYDIPLSLVILYSFIAGVITTIIYLISTVFVYKRRAREMRIALENNREELDNLRRNPLKKFKQINVHEKVYRSIKELSQTLKMPMAGTVEHLLRYKEKYEEKKKELESYHADFQQYVDEQNGGFDVE